MTSLGVLQIVAYLAVLIALVPLLGRYMADVYAGTPTVLSPVLAPLERMVYRLAGIDAAQAHDWRGYALALLGFNLAGLVAVYAILRLQALLPLNPQAFAALPADLAFNTAVSFVTNTNWQAYSGEATLSYASQMVGLCVQNFLSAATGMAVLVALIRGFTNRESQDLGNFWVDLTRGTVHILLPLSLVLALLLVGQGVVQSLAPYRTVRLVEPLTYSAPATTADAGGAGSTAATPTLTTSEQTVPLGPAASQIAIKQLGTNGGGFFGANSAHPLENPTPLSNFLEVLSILLIPAALCSTFGHLVKDARQGWALLAAMLVIFVPLTFACYAAEQSLVPGHDPGLVDARALASQAGGNAEGKEVRFGIAGSALWATATTAASNGSANASYDSFTPLGGLVPMFLIQLGEVVFGGVGSGLYGMLMFAIVAVFVGGLMVGRTPEYLGKKIEAFEVKMASIALLLPCALALVGTAIACATPLAAAAVGNPGAHGFSEILYALSSAANNNGSAFGGLNSNLPFYNVLTGVAMWLSRFCLIIPVLAIAGSLGRKRVVAHSAGTLPTHTPLFVTLLVAVVLLVGALNFVPALALGPIAEQLQQSGSRP